MDDGPVHPLVLGYRSSPGCNRVHILVDLYKLEQELSSNRVVKGLFLLHSCPPEPRSYGLKISQ